MPGGVVGAEARPVRLARTVAVADPELRGHPRTRRTCRAPVARVALARRVQGHQLFLF